MVFGVMARAVEYNENDAVRIHHLIKVHSFARISERLTVLMRIIRK